MSRLNVRRATIDDLDVLRATWLAMKLPADELEKRLNEFQVVEADGQVAGAIGIQFLNPYALLHSEGFLDFAIADDARQLFWERIQKLASNHGVFRIWTQENSPFWTRWGFQPANAETLSKLPAAWKTLEGQWLTLPLKDEDAISAALQNKFGGLMDAEKEQTARVSEKAQTLKTVITILGFAIFFLCMGVIAWWFMHGRIALR